MYSGIAVRASFALGLHRPSPSPTRIDAEHLKRLFWTTAILDCTTASLNGLQPGLSFDNVEIGMPSDQDLGPGEAMELGNCDMLNMNIDICKVNTAIFDVISRLQSDDFANYGRAIQAPLEQLDQWRANLPPRYCLDLTRGLPQIILDMPEMRSLASLYMRYYQVRRPVSNETTS